MHLLEQYALTTGVKITKPHIETSYYPFPFDKYIVLENGHDIKSRTYGMWSDIILEIKPLLDENEIIIVQIGSSNDEAIPGCYDLRGKTTIKQNAYLLKKCLYSLNKRPLFIKQMHSFSEQMPLFND